MVTLGPDAGFIVELFLDQENYMLEGLSRKAGARLVTHDPEHAAYPDEYGNDLQPNTASSIAIQKVRAYELHLSRDFHKL